MPIFEALNEGATLAEAEGMTAELGDLLLWIAAQELEAGNLEDAQVLLDGLAVTNPFDPVTWAMLAQLHRRLGRQLAARACAETAAHLAPNEPEVKLVRAEVMLGFPEEVENARQALVEVGAEDGAAGERARALLQGLG